MDGSRGLTRIALVGAGFGALFLVLGLLDVGGFGWFQAHGRVLLGGFLLPLLMAAHAVTLARLARAPLDAAKLHLAGGGVLAGSLLFALGWLFQPSPLLSVVGVAGLVLVAAAGIVYAVHVMKTAPKGGLTTPDDPLTKGDDACLKHVHFSHRFLALGLLLQVVAAALAFVSPDVWQLRVHVAAQHVLLVGFGLLSLYGIGHFWVPRFSGVPAIAAGAIKGELHTTLLGLAGLLLGFLLDQPGLTLGLGFFVFVGFFTYMGVLGANIMKNKSKTQRVTPEFTYIPWTFTGIFWLISAVLLGLFLNAVPDVLSERAAALRFTHVHVALLGGAVQLLMSWAIPARADALGVRPPRFDGRMKGSFYAFNAAVTLAVWARFADAAATWWYAALGLLALSLVLYTATVGGLKRPAPLATA